MLNVIIALLLLNILVIAHEFGHYIFAKLNKIAVDEFAIGFGPVIYQRKVGETMWSIRLFPLGGFNGLKGETELESGPGNFLTASKKARLQVLFAGSLMNVAVAVIAFYFAIFLYGGKVATPINFTPVGARITYANEKYPKVTQYVKDSPADKLGLPLPFSIVTVNGAEVSSPADVVEKVSVATSDPIQLRIKVKDEFKDVVIVRDQNKKLGINIEPAELAIDYNESFVTKALSGFSHAANSLIMTKEMLGLIIKASIKSRSAEPLGYAFAGPVAIVAAVGDVVKNSKEVVADLANMTGLIGVSLAVFNLLPFPGLDGWHIILVLYEKVRGRKPNQKLVGLISTIGFFVLLAFGVFIMIKDVIFFFLK